jgi:CubicO group peptidase (beta-lactamase class C family)
MGRTASWPCALVLAAAAAAQKGPPPGTVAEGELGMRLDNAVTRNAATFWGAVLVAIDGKPVLAKGYGFADRTKVPLGPQSLLDLGGAAQQLTLIAALRLVAEQKLALADSVGKFVPDWPAERAGLTVQELLAHTSGLAPELRLDGAAAASAKGAGLAFARAPLAGRIGAEFRYAPANANLLALVLELAAQQKFEKVLVDRVLRPAGMTTALPLGQRADSKLVTSRRTPANERGDPADRAEWNWSHRGARGVLASVLDVHALLLALTTGKLLPDELRAVAWKPITGTDYGVTALPANGDTLVRVHGSCTGYRARWTVDPGSRSWVVILAEDYGNTDAVEAALCGEAWQAVAALKAPAAPAPAAGEPGTATTPGADAAAAWPPAAVERFAGTFTLPRGGGVFRIERSGAGVRLCGIGLQASARVLEGRWPPPGEDRLRRAEDRGLSLLKRALANDASVDQDGCEAGSVGAAARAELAAWVAANGAPTAVEYAGTTLQGHGETWFRIANARAEAFVRAAWSAKSTWMRCTVAAEPLPFAAELVLVRPDVAVANLPGGRLVLSMEGRDDARNLLFEDDSPGEHGLLDCPLAPPVR